MTCDGGPFDSASRESPGPCPMSIEELSCGRPACTVRPRRPHHNAFAAGCKKAYGRLHSRMICRGIPTGCGWATCVLIDSVAAGSPATVPGPIATAAEARPGLSPTACHPEADTTFAGATAPPAASTRDEASAPESGTPPTSDLRSEGRRPLPGTEASLPDAEPVPAGLPIR